jgi:hypothetical protein
MSRQNREALDDISRQLEDVRNENLDLKEVIREMKRDRLVLSNNQTNMAYGQEQYYDDPDEYNEGPGM